MAKKSFTKKVVKKGVSKAAKAAPRKNTGSAIMHVEIPAPEFETLIAFYREVFGWKVQKLASQQDYEHADRRDSREPRSDYALFSTPTIGGGFASNMEVVDKGVCIYLTVDDISGTLAAVGKKGGSILARKTKISDEYGFYGIFKDPCGNRLGVWSQK